MSKSTMTRRALVASTAAVPAAAALSLPAIAAAEPDPIFAAIEEYQRASDEYGAAIDAQAAIDRRPDGSLAIDSPDWKNAEDRISQTCTAYTQAIRKLSQTAPTTLAGLAAVLSFVIGANDQGDDLLSTFAEDKYKGSDDERDTCMWPFLKTVRQSVELMARVAA
jgi:hypothetical protein